MPNAFAIAVTGSMNPAIHHPTFYERQEIVSDEEAAAAIQQPDMMCLAQFAQLSFAGIRIVAMPNAWTATTTDLDRVGRLVEVCATVFAVLDHTPVSGFSISCDLVRELRVASVARILAHVVAESRVGFPFVEAGMGALSLTSVQREEQVSRRTTHSLDTLRDAPPAQVLARSNFVYDIHVTGHFDLGPILRPRVSRDLDETRLFLQRASDALEEIEGTQHA